MKILILGIIFVIAGSLGGTAAFADGDAAIVQECAKKTGATGADSVKSANGRVEAVPGEGATASGAAAVNDCLLDVYQVQFTTVPISEQTEEPEVEVVDGSEVIDVIDNCGRGLNIFRGGNGYCRD